MGIAFGRLVVDGVEFDDPYRPRLDELPRFEVISDAGPRYQVERSGERSHLVWSLSRLDPPPATSLGKILRRGNVMNRWYSYKRDDRVLSSGSQNILVNAVFGLIGEFESDAPEFRHS